jgi:hypothetical protein
LLSGFADGQAIHYWDFGEAPTFAAPIFALIRRDGDGAITPVSHRTIIEAIPGDPGYSPYWTVWFVEVTDKYAGEIIPSVAAMQEAERLGLVSAPVMQRFAVNCPAVSRDISLEVGAGNPALAPPSTFYWQGKTVRYYDLGTLSVPDGVSVPESPRYVLRREGQEPLSEPVRGVDMTGDGDVKDSNDILERLPSDADYTPQSRIVRVVVPQAYRSIDTSLDDSDADFRAASDLFNPDPVVGNVIAFDETTKLRNNPVQREAGAL